MRYLPCEDMRGMGGVELPVSGLREEGEEMNYECPELETRLTGIEQAIKALEEAAERAEKMQAVLTGLRSELAVQSAIVHRIRYESRVVAAPAPDEQVDG